MHRSLFNFLPQRRRKLSTCPHVLNFFGTCTIISPPQVCVLCTCEWKSIGFHSNSFQKSRPAFFKTTLFFTIDKKKKQFELLLFHARFASHFPLQFRKTIDRQSEAGNRGCIARRRIKKDEEEHMHPITKSLLLITNVSCSSMDPKSTDVPPSLWSYRRSHLSASIAETGNEQHYRIITSDGILLHEIDRYYDYWRLLKIKHALAAICW